MLNISYARARLWIGISGVGLIVVACVAGISLQLPPLFLPTSGSGLIADLGWLAAAVILFVAIMAPLDFWGGYLAPTRFNQQPISLGRFLRQWSRGVIVQSLLFVASSIVILTVGRNTGLFGAATSVVVMAILYVAWQSRLVAAMTGGTTHTNDDKVDRSLDRVQRWGLKRLPVTVIQNTDPGFTGGVLGLPRFESIIIPRDYVDQLTSEQLDETASRSVQLSVAKSSSTHDPLDFVASHPWILDQWQISGTIVRRRFKGVRFSLS